MKSIIGSCSEIRKQNGRKYLGESVMKLIMKFNLELVDTLGL